MIRYVAYVLPIYLLIIQNKNHLKSNKNNKQFTGHPLEVVSFVIIHDKGIVILKLVVVVGEFYVEVWKSKIRFQYFITLFSFWLPTDFLNS